jgi:hypothetical protein
MEAEAILAEQLDQFKIAIAGTGEDFGRYWRYIRNPQHYEVLNEYIPDERVAGLFQRASVVVLPYIEASQSAVVPMAFAFGKPVVATEVGSIPEIVDHGKNGFLVKPRNSQHLAGAILQVLENPELRKRMSQEAGGKAYGEWSCDRVAQMHMKAYAHTLARFREKKQAIEEKDRRIIRNLCTTDVQYLEFLLRKNVGAAPCGRPQDGQPQGVAPTIKELFLVIGAVVISIFSLVAALPHCVLCAFVVNGL